MSAPVFEYTKHKAIWDEITRSPESSKFAVFILVFGKDEGSKLHQTIRNNCFACEYAIKVSNNIKNFCDFCPLEGMEDCAIDSLYHCWANRDDYVNGEVHIKWRDIPREIRDATIKDGVVWR